MSTPEYSKLKSVLLNAQGPLAARFQALFALRSLGTSEAIQIIGAAFQDSSALLGHEVAYVLGQIGSQEALPALEGVLRDTDMHPMTRHEAAEAMGAISSPDSLPLLRQYRDAPDEHVAVKETCEIAVQKIEWDHGLGKAERTQKSIYDSIDPAPPLSMHDTATPDSSSIPELRRILLDTSLSLFQRYRAMFSLRNLGEESKEAVLALADGFSDSSALFRHEIAYIFGQLVSPHSVPALTHVLNDTKEDEMVRHEAAEALGSIGTPEVYPLLKTWLERADSPRVVRESCQVALDMAESDETYGDFSVPEGQHGMQAARLVSVSA